jgi:peptidoglycan/LPS O-acetylase OafA/YrhL
MPDDKTPKGDNSPNNKTAEIDMNAVGAGCATGFGAGCLQVVLMLMIVAASGIQLAGLQPQDIPPVFRISGFALGLLGDVVVGYVTAHAAPHAKMRHALVVGMIWTLLASVVLLFSPEPQVNVNEPWTLLAFVLTLPMMLLGAKLAIDGNREDVK